MAFELHPSSGSRIQLIGNGNYMPDDQPPVLTPPPIQPTPPPASPSKAENDARLWNMLCHLSALTALVGVPFGNILGPLVVWQIKKNEIPSVEVHGKAALNFQITTTLALLGLAVVTFIGSFLCLGVILIPVLMLGAVLPLVFTVIAGIKANNGEAYRYPWSYPFIK
jgi:uncharacterized protein